MLSRISFVKLRAAGQLRLPGTTSESSMYPAFVVLSESEREMGEDESKHPEHAGCDHAASGPSHAACAGVSQPTTFFRSMFLPSVMWSESDSAREGAGNPRNIWRCLRHRTRARLLLVSTGRLANIAAFACFKTERSPSSKLCFIVRSCMLLPILELRFIFCDVLSLTCELRKCRLAGSLIRTCEVNVLS